MPFCRHEFSRRDTFEDDLMVGAGTNRARQAPAGGLAIVLVRPQLAVNIGMCARAMANFGLDDLRLVDPRGGWPREGAWHKAAYAAAASASALLDRARVFASVEEAVADLNYLYATTARERGQLKRIFTPAAAMPEAASAVASGEKRGVLFGPERTGLDNDDVALADAILTFPVSPGYASLNLAQAVLLCGYEWFKAAHGDVAPFAAPERSPPATREMTLAFFEMLEGHLDARGFFRPAPKKPVMQRNLRNIFHRIGMTQQDVRTLWGAIVRLVEGPRVTVRTRKRRRPKKEGGAGEGAASPRPAKRGEGGGEAAG
jgi:tRNA/rRNA methyltransferase